MKLFVCGNLMRGHRRASVLRTERFLREAVTAPHFKLFDLGGFPGLARVEGDGRAVSGELFEVRPGLQALLDRIEGAPALLRLERVEVDGEEGEVFAYVLRVRVTDPVVVESNRWEAA